MQSPKLTSITRFLVAGLATGMAIAFALLAVMPAHAADADADAEAAARIEAFTQKALDAGFNPAFAVAVVHGDREILAGAWGRIDVGHRTPDVATRFYIASSTKSLTGLAAATLVDAGRIELSAPLDAYVDVRAPEGLPPERFSVGALLTHTHGLDNGPLVIRTAYTGQHDRQTLVDLVPTSRVVEEAAFDYSNEGYNLFGLALAELTDSPDWRGGVRSLVLDPLGLADTTAFLSHVPADALALPFNYEPGPGLVRMPLHKTDRTLHAAGGHFMSARDAARWLRANLTGGVIEGERLLPAGVFEIAHAPRAETGSEFGGYARESYGLGWHRGVYDGDEMLHHFGSFPGYRSHISFMPKEDVGVAVFTNTSGPGFAVVDIVANYAYDVLRGLEDADARGAERLAQLTAEAETGMARYAKHLEDRRARKSHLTLAPGAYAGRYESPELGVLEVEAVGDKLLFRAGDATSLAENFERPEAVRVELPPGRGNVATFALEDGAVAAVEVAGTRWTRREGP